MIIPNPGDLLTITRPYSPLYPPHWIRGEQPIILSPQTHVIFLESFLESDYGGGTPRTFFRIITPRGIGTMNSVFLRRVE